MVLLATFCGLRLGELRALRRRHLDLLHRTVKVVEQYQELADGTLVLGPPKTDAGLRTVADPGGDGPPTSRRTSPSGRRPARRPGVPQHDRRAAAPSDALHGMGPSDEGRRRRRAAVPRPSPHPQHPRRRDRREHQGADVPHGPRVARAALIYQHATKDRDAAIAAGLSDLIERTLADTSPPVDTAPTELAQRGRRQNDAQ